MNNGQFIQVILPLRLEWRPWYFVPAELGCSRIGEKVRVLFSNRKYTGIICNISAYAPADIDVSKIKSIECIERNLAPISRNELRFWEQLAQYYMCTIGEVARTTFPASRLDREEVEARKKQLIEAREARAREARERRMQRLEGRRARLENMLKKARKAETREKYAAELAAMEREITDIKGGQTSRGTGGSDLHRTDNIGLSFTGIESQSSRADHSDGITLSAAQEKAYGEIKTAFNEKKTALLAGVTGSGKTEIYMKLAAETMVSGRNVLYLVPEIALSRQLEHRLSKVFGDSLMVFHSHETNAKRGQVASMVAAATAGSNYIVLGTRSALFLPHHELGLIVVDEEHDSSYKQDSPAPRYNGRDAAAMLAQIEDARLLLGSATPSLESLYNCSTGRYAKIELSERYHGESDIEVEIIDTKAERRKRGMHGNFSRKLIAHINDTLAEGRQVLILRARRSYAPAVQCSGCGDIPKCPRCNISLSLHKTQSGDRLVCHHCGNSYRYDGICAICGSPMENIGAGTQKIWEEACALFPQAHVDRIDSDITRRPQDERAVIDDFANGRTDILVGTQMVSKGFDFERLGLVAVIQADTLLSIQDFRADEKALQLLEQFKGRCARRGGRGLFVLQTSIPDYPVFTELQEGSENDMLEERKRFGYPPFFRIVIIRARDKFAERAEQFCTILSNEIYMTLGAACDEEVDLGDGISGKCVNIVGPYTPPRETEDGQHLRELRISLARTKQLTKYKQLIYNTINSFISRTKYDGTVSIDVDPS